MIVRPLDENGDMMPIRNVEQMISGKDAVAQVINLRLQFFYGEWWEDRSLGFRVPDLLVNNAKAGDMNLLAKYIASYISNSTGVRGVTDVAATLANHEMKFFCTAFTDTGETTTVEVDMNGIL